MERIPEELSGQISEKNPGQVSEEILDVFSLEYPEKKSSANRS